ncbi:SUMF1/EgtB/PvdO family nonheme iron enzyme [Bacteroidota bacterium]
MLIRLVCLIVFSFTMISYSQTLEIEWCNVPAGPFTWSVNNFTRTIDYDYQIMKYEVTNAQYARYLKEALSAGELTQVDSSTVKGYYEGDSIWTSGEYEYLELDDSDCKINFSINFIDSNFIIQDGYQNHPVLQVTWFGAWAFAKHYGLRLPTAEEWEKAARDNDSRDYPWGNDVDGSRANYENSGDPFDDGTTPVGYYDGSNHNGFQTTDSPSPYGAYDMGGNVYEWTISFDRWWSGLRHVRGGCWAFDMGYMTCYYGDDFSPQAGDPITGFRCAKDSITVQIKDEQNLPDNYELHQNYPNPYNFSTTIKYSIPKQSFVQLRIFDNISREITILVSKEQSPGNYNVEFDGSNLSSGVYFYRLQTGDYVETKKMILMK